MTSQVRLRIKHPNLFKMILLVGISNLVIAMFTAFDSPRASTSFTRIASIDLVHRPSFWVVIFLVSGLMCLAGACSTKYQYARFGLILSAAVGSFLALGFWLSYFSIGTVGISAPVIWTFYSIVCIIYSSEPSVNPLSALLQQDIHSTISNHRANKNGL